MRTVPSAPGPSRSSASFSWSLDSVGKEDSPSRTLGVRHFRQARAESSACAGSAEAAEQAGQGVDFRLRLPHRLMHPGAHRRVRRAETSPRSECVARRSARFDEMIESQQILIELGFRVRAEQLRDDTTDRAHWSSAEVPKCRPPGDRRQLHHAPHRRPRPSVPRAAL